MSNKIERRDETVGARNGAAVTPSDSADLAYTTRAVWVGGAGNLRVTLEDMAEGASITLVGVSGLVPLACSRIWSTNTTATNIHALW